MANVPQYDQAAARADKMLEPDGSIQTHSGTVVSGPNPSLATAYSQATARADKLLQPDGSIITSGSGSGGTTNPGGTTGQLQYNNGGTAFGGITGSNTDGTNLYLGGYTGTGSGLIMGSGANQAVVIQNPGGTQSNQPITITGGSSSTLPQIVSYTANLAIRAVANGQIQFTYAGGGQYTASFYVQSSLANGFLFYGGTTGLPPQIQVSGTDTNISMKIVPKGTGAVLCTGVVVTGVYTVATLPAAAAGIQGARALVTDATAPTFLGTLTGGGSVICPVFCTGSAWLAG